MRKQGTKNRCQNFTKPAAKITTCLGLKLGLNMSKRASSISSKIALGTRIACVGLTVSLLALTGACTTVEGGNAFIDMETFGREVVDETVIGLGMKPRIYKDVPKNQRAELVLPKQGQVGAPSEGRVAELPQDSDGVIIDPNKVTPAMVRRIRQARVVDTVDIVAGRVLTPQERKRLSQQIVQARLLFQQSRSVTLFEPPKDYFTSLGGSDLICLAPDGELVLLDDPKCPADIRAALDKVRAEEKARDRLREKQRAEQFGNGDDD